MLFLAGFGVRLREVNGPNCWLPARKFVALIFSG